MSLKCKKCKDILVEKDIKSKNSFLKWSRKNHPDKGGDSPVFQEVSNCVDMFFKNNECDINKNYPVFKGVFEKSNYQKRREERAREETEREETEREEREKREKREKYFIKPCKDGYERNIDNNRCRIKCKDYQYRDPFSKRCRKSHYKEKKSPSSKNIKPCKDGYERSLKSGNCVKKCGPGQYRSSETFRCKKDIKSPQNK